jgi:LysM repeat protein
VSPDRLRVWAARLAAPLAFFFAVTVLVLLVKGGLEREPDALSNGAPTTERSDTNPAPPPEAETDTEPRERQFYRVRAGDTLESIAERFDTDVQTLLELNPGIDPLALSPRQRIRVQ